MACLALVLVLVLVVGGPSIFVAAANVENSGANWQTMLARISRIGVAPLPWLVARRRARLPSPISRLSTSASFFAVTARQADIELEAAIPIGTVLIVSPSPRLASADDRQSHKTDGERRVTNEESYRHLLYRKARVLIDRANGPTIIIQSHLLLCRKEPESIASGAPRIGLL